MLRMEGLPRIQPTNLRKFWDNGLAPCKQPINRSCLQKRLPHTRMSVVALLILRPG